MAIAVKAFIINDSKVLIAKRALDDIQKPGIWEIPSGRVDENEDMEEGLIRGVKEETGLNIEISREISTRDFKLDDREEIEMHIFLCNAVNNKFDKVKISEEHSSYEWIEIGKCKSKLDGFFHPEVDLLLNLENERWP